MAAPAVATVEAGKPGPEIPKSFMGLSREWRVFVAPDEGPPSAVHPTYLQLLKNLCAFNDAPLCIRVGGNSADGIKESPSPDRWKQMGEVFKATRTPLIININLAREDVELDKAMINDAHKYVPKEAIATFELGNEPDGWANRYRPADYTFEQYLPVFNRIAKELVPALTPGVAGPAWAHAAPPKVIKEFLAAQPGLINMITVHSYRFDPKRKPPVEKLLNEGDTAGYAKNLIPGIQTAHDAGLKIRMTEAGSAWGGGIEGFSDSFAVSLWTLDVLFELAKAGLDGIHFHGGGLGHYSPIREDVDKATRKAVITARAPYYGMLVFAEATANNAQFLPVTEDTGKIKLWPTVDKTGVVRVIVINKETASAGEITLKLAGSKASVKRLIAPSLGATEGITWAGQTFDGSKDGTPVGVAIEESISIKDGTLNLKLTPASAALLTVLP